MKRHSILAALALPLAAACASTPPAADTGVPAQPLSDPSQVAVYYVGQKPQCGVVRIGEVQGRTETELRYAAWQMRGNAVVAVRSRLFVVEQPRGAYRRTINGPGTVRVFQGVAARVADRCTI